MATQPGISDGSYTVKALYDGQPNPSVVEVSFLLAYPDWCELEQSNEWRNLLVALERFGKE